MKLSTVSTFIFTILLSASSWSATEGAKLVLVVPICRLAAVQAQFFFTAQKHPQLVKTHFQKVSQQIPGQLLTVRQNFYWQYLWR